MKRKWIVAAVAAGLFSAAALAQWGPGMMGGYGGYGGGYGPMMGYGGYGHMQGYGGGYGPMHGGYGPGAGGGWCWGNGGGGYGPGAMMGYGWGAGYGLDSLGLSEEQQKKIASIQEDLWNKRFALMQSMHTLGWKSFGPGATSDADASKAYEAMAALRKQMFDTSLEGRKRIDEVLTKEQREKLRSGPRGGW